MIYKLKIENILNLSRLNNEILVIELLVNVKESMGANIVNTIAEHTAPFI